MSSFRYQYRVGNIEIVSKTKLCAEYTSDNVIVGRTTTGRGAVWCYLSEVYKDAVAKCRLPQGTPTVRLESHAPADAQVMPLCPVPAEVPESNDGHLPDFRLPGISRVHQI